MGVTIKPDSKYIKTDTKARAIFKVQTEQDNNDEADIFTRILNLYPDYSSIFHHTQTSLMTGDGSLPLSCRHFIGFMAARVSKSSTLQSYAKKTFLAVGGIESWTRNPNLVPNKLKRITPLMEILWRFPWKVSQHQLKDLCVDGWTVSELIEAIVIVCHYQSLRCFLIGTGQDSHYLELNEVQNQESNHRECNLLGGGGSPLGLEEFSWDEQGFSLMSSLCSDMALNIDDKMRLAKNMRPSEDNVKNFNAENICSYVQSLHKIHQDDWSLEWMEESRNQDAQNFVYYCTLPHLDQSSNVNFVKLSKKISYSLKVYISIIVMESKLKSQLLYFLNAVMKHLS